MFYCRRLAARRGTAAVEFAVMLPFLVLLLIVLTDFARVFYYGIVVGYCARDGAMYAAQGPVQAADQKGIENAARKDAAQIASQLTVQAVKITTDSNKNKYATATCTYTFKTVTSYLGARSSMTLTRAATARIAQATNP